MDGEHQITEITRRAIADHFDLHQVDWAGSFSQAEFLARLYDLENMPSHDHRFKTASGDIWQHTSNNDDWNLSWPFTDRRFHLMHVSDDKFLRFLAETLHPLVRPSAENARELAAAYNEHLQHDGWQLVENRLISGRPVYGAQSTNRAVVFQEPTGWARVDRQVQEMRTRLEAAGNEEQYQTVGLICREVLISAAQEVFDAGRHPALDDTEASETDARRMLERIFEAELAGATNTEARAHAKAAVRLALALQHKRTADFRTAALCAEGTASVVNMLAIIAGRRGGRR